MSSYSKQKYEDAKKQNTETLEKLKNLDLQLRSIEDRWKADAIEEEQKLAFSTQQTIKALQEESIRVCEQHKNKAIKEIQLIGNLSNRTYYEYSNADIEKIFGELREQLRISR